MKRQSSHLNQKRDPSLEAQWTAKCAEYEATADPSRLGTKGLTDPVAS